MIIVFIAAAVGAFVGAFITAELISSIRRNRSVSSQVGQSSFLINGSKQIVHIRGDGKPGAFEGVRCSAEYQSIPKDKDGNLLRGFVTTLPCGYSCEFVDSSMRYWCRFHVPKDALVLERAVAGGDGHATGVCAAHGIDCPKPWSLA